MKRSLSVAAVLISLGLVGWLFAKTYNNTQRLQEERGERQTSVQIKDLPSLPLELKLAPFKFDPLKLKKEREDFFAKATPKEIPPREREILISHLRQRGLWIAAGWPKHKSRAFNEAEQVLIAELKYFASAYETEALSLILWKTSEEFLLALEHHLGIEGQTPSYPGSALNKTSAPQLASLLSTEGILRGLRILSHDVPFFSANVAAPEGFLSKSGKLSPKVAPLLQILYLYYWSDRLRPEIKLSQLMTHYERLVLRRWQIESSRAPLEIKLALLERAGGVLELEEIAYDRAALLFLMGRTEEAKATLKEAIQEMTAKKHSNAAARLGAILKQLPE